MLESSHPVRWIDVFLNVLGFFGGKEGDGSVDRGLLSANAFCFAAVGNTGRRHETYLDISSSGSRTGQRLASTSSPEGGVMSRGRPTA